MKTTQPLILVFCKAPQLGTVKTRLAAKIGAEKALAIYQSLMQKTFEVVNSIPVEKQIWYSEPHASVDKLPSKTEIHIQQGQDLGQRMSNAFEKAFRNFGPILIVGTDLWTLEKTDLNHAFKQLETHDVVIGPASDGGYYLLGMNTFYPSLFQNKTWSSDRVLQDTLADLKNQSVFLLDQKNDIDTFEDLQNYPELLKSSR